MEDEVLYGYHATDQSNVASILKNNFKPKDNDRHWLGKGTYFFIDPALAKKWGSESSKRYGEINSPVFIRAKINKSDGVCDMRYLEDHNFVSSQFREYFANLVSNNNLRLKFKTPKDKKIYYEKIRCAFFIWLSENFELKGIISYFNERKLSELESGKYRDFRVEMFRDFKMPYVECQICIYDNTIIKEMQCVDLWGGERDGI